MQTLKYKLHSYDNSGNGLYYAEYAGKSTESKPTTGLISGSVFLEVDTGKTFVLDAISTPASWNEKVFATAEVTTP